VRSLRGFETDAVILFEASETHHAMISDAVDGMCGPCRRRAGQMVSDHRSENAKRVLFRERSNHRDRLTFGHSFAIEVPRYAHRVGYSRDSSGSAPPALTAARTALACCGET